MNEINDHLPKALKENQHLLIETQKTVDDLGQPNQNQAGLVKSIKEVAYSQGSYLVLFDIPQAIAPEDFSVTDKIKFKHEWIFDNLKSVRSPAANPLLMLTPEMRMYIDEVLHMAKSYNVPVIVQNEGINQEGAESFIKSIKSYNSIDDLAIACDVAPSLKAPIEEPQKDAASEAFDPLRKIKAIREHNEDLIIRNKNKPD